MTDSDRHQRLRAVFDEALEQDPSAREWYLDRVCAAWPDLRAEVTRLLRAHDRAGLFLERPATMDSFSSNRRLSI